MNDAEFEYCLSQVETFRGWLAALEAEGSRRLFNGQKVFGKKLVLSQKNRVWTNPKKAKELLIELGVPEDDVAPRSMCSPAQAEKALNRFKLGAQWNIVSALVDRPQGKPTMVDESNRRPEYIPGSEFGIVDDLIE